MSPEGKRVVEAATAVFAHLDSLIGDPVLKRHVDVLRRFVYGELDIPIAGSQSHRGSVTLECDEREALASLFRIAAMVLPGSRLITPAEIEAVVERLVESRRRG